LDKQEPAKMLQEFWEFDRKLIREKYQHIIDEVGEKVGI
jgi:hypothetical protein